MILLIKLIFPCFFIFPFCQFYCMADLEEPDIDVTVLANNSFTVLTDDCHYLLQSFADASAQFTFCAINSARPITLCQDCKDSYLLAVKVHQDILKLIDRAGELCKQKLLNLDRLQIVEGALGFISGLWKRAKCDSCYEMDSDGRPKQLKKEITYVLSLQNKTDICIRNHINDTVFNKVGDPKVCFECKQQYLELNAYYNSLEVSSPICMDIIDMLNTTRQDWSVSLGCCLDRKNPEYMFLISSGLVSVLPVLFYLLACKFAGNKEHQVILLRNRCSIPYPEYVPPTPPVTEDAIPGSSNKLVQPSSDNI